MPQNARMLGGRRFLEVRKYKMKHDATEHAKRIRGRGMLARVTHESDGMYAAWQGPKR